ncbi:MAG: hypothetical protein IPK78_16400 [Rhodospirillales bacterium]|nr:hypothetical protein [Rhodospirillales bacterium]
MRLGENMVIGQQKAWRDEKSGSVTGDGSVRLPNLQVADGASRALAELQPVDRHQIAAA